MLAVLLAAAALVDADGIRLTDRALQLYKTGQYAEAEAVYRQVLTKHSPGKPGQNYVAALGNLALSVAAQGRTPEARELFERAIAIQSGLEGDDARRALTLANYAIVLRDSGDFLQARSVLTRALKLQRAALPAGDPALARTLHNLATVHTSLGQHKAAERLLDEALALYRANPEFDPIARSASEAFLAAYAAGRGQLKRARELTASVLALRESRLGADHPKTAAARIDHAHVLSLLGQRELSVPEFERAITDAEAKLGAAHPTFARALWAYAEHWRRGNAWAQADALYRRAAGVAATVHGADSSLYAEVIASWAQVLKAQGSGADARRLEQRAETIRRERPLERPGLLSIDVSAFRR
jgi:tetratricopeptide (TPR) repeat protein